MAHPVLSQISGSPLGRAGLATISILALAGFAGGGLPLMCKLAPGAAFCASGTIDEASDPVAEAAADEVNGLAPGAGLTPALGPGPQAQVQTALLEQAPSLTQNDLVAATFEALRVGLTSAPSNVTSRKVKTISIKADGTPVTEHAVAVADPAPSPNQTEAGKAQTPPARAAEQAESATSLAYAPARGDSATVSGKGANVRSLPQKGGSEVLFALAGGAEVTIVEMRKGWAKVVDARGRSGWIYGVYLTRG